MRDVSPGTLCFVRVLDWFRSVWAEVQGEARDVAPRRR
jgi:hypothetical protein